MIKVVDGLRHRKNYRSNRQDKGRAGDPVFQRVKITSKPLNRLPDPLTYIFQSYWPVRAIFQDGQGQWSKQAKKRRISEPYHSLYLLWLDRWSLKDLTLLLGIEVRKKGFKLTRRSVH